MHYVEQMCGESLFSSNATSSELSHSLQIIHIAQYSRMEDITHFCPWPHSDCSATSSLQLFYIHENAIFQTICITSCLFNRVKKESSGDKGNTIKMNPTDHLLLYYFCSLSKLDGDGFEFSLWSAEEEEVTYTMPTTSAKATVWLWLALSLKFWYIVSCSESLFLLHDEVSCSTFTTKHTSSWVVGLGNKKHKLHSSAPFSYKDFYSSVWARVHMHMGDCRPDVSGMRLPKVCKCTLVTAVFKVAYGFGPGILLATPCICPQHSAELWLLFDQYLFLCHEAYTRHCPACHPLWN